MDESMFVVNPVTDAVLHVNVQTAFMNNHLWNGLEVLGGGMPVPGGTEILPVIEKVDALFPTRRRFASLVQRPPMHVAFAESYKGMPPFSEISPADVRHWEWDTILSPHFDLRMLKDYLAKVRGCRQTLWPRHAVINTPEAELHPALADQGFRLVLVTGYDRICDSYSAESDILGRTTGLAEQMIEEGVQRLFIDGLAYTHCVGWTALGFASRGIATFVIKDATRPMVATGSDLEGEMDLELMANGVFVITSDQLAGVAQLG